MRTVAKLLGGAFLLPALVAAQEGTALTPPCTIPFDAIAMDHKIDHDCGPQGKTSSVASQVQNEAKNNFCASGDPARVTRWSFVRLQRASDKAGVTGLQEDRSPLQNLYTTSDGNTIGEGSLVQFVGFILDAHHSNVSDGESVNCKRGGRETTTSTSSSTSHGASRISAIR